MTKKTTRGKMKPLLKYWAITSKLEKRGQGLKATKRSNEQVAEGTSRRRESIQRARIKILDVN